MIAADIIYERTKTLPEVQAREVLDFFEYLPMKLKKQSTNTPLLVCQGS